MYSADDEFRNILPLPSLHQKSCCKFVLFTKTCSPSGNQAAGRSMASEITIEEKPVNSKFHQHQQKNYPLMSILTFHFHPLILDLDETLVHLKTQLPGVKYDFMVMMRLERQIMPIFVVKRPGVTEFLQRIGENYKVVVYTAGLEDYASQVLDKLDKNGVISQRLYRDSCTEVNGKYVKDLSFVVGKDLGSALIVDDNPTSYSLQPENGLLIKAFVDDLKDQELLKLAEFLDSCYAYKDMRDAVKDCWKSG